MEAEPLPPPLPPSLGAKGSSSSTTRLGSGIRGSGFFSRRRAAGAGVGRGSGSGAGGPFIHRSHSASGSVDGTSSSSSTLNKGGEDVGDAGGGSVKPPTKSKGLPPFLLFPTKSPRGLRRANSSSISAGRTGGGKDGGSAAAIPPPVLHHALSTPALFVHGAAGAEAGASGGGDSGMREIPVPTTTTAAAAAGMGGEKEGEGGDGSWLRSSHITAATIAALQVGGCVETVSMMIDRSVKLDDDGWFIIYKSLHPTKSTHPTPTHTGGRRHRPPRPGDARGAGGRRPPHPRPPRAAEDRGAPILLR